MRYVYKKVKYPSAGGSVSRPLASGCFAPRI